MTTVPRRHMKTMATDTPIFIAGPSKYVRAYTARDSFDFDQAKFARFLLHDQEQLEASYLRSKESPLTIHERKMTAMSTELSKIKHDEFVDRKRREQLRSECVELRELAEHLRGAYISKDIAERMTQINQRRQLSVNAKIQGRLRAEAERLKQLDFEREEELKSKLEQQKLCATLATQIEEQRRRRQQECEETVADRERRIAMQQIIEEERKAEYLEQQQLKLKKRNEIVEFIEQQKAYKEFLREQDKADKQKATDDQHYDQERNRKHAEARLQAQRQHQEISLRIGKELYEFESQKRQRDNILLDLLQEEYKVKSEERYRQELEQDQTQRRRVRQELERYRYDVMERKQEQLRLKREALEARRQESNESQEALNKQEQIEGHQRRQEYGAMLLNMIEQNQRKRAEAAAENVQFFDMQEKAYAERQARINEERLKMLADVPSSVLGYLPGYMLSNDDRERFDIPKQQMRLGGGDS